MAIKIYPFECECQWVNLDPSDKTAQYESIKRAAAISYDNKTKRNPEDFVEMIMARGHYSVLEQSNIGLKIQRNIFDKYDTDLDILGFKELMLSKHLNISLDQRYIYLCGSLRDFLNSLLRYNEQIERHDSWSYFNNQINDLIYYAKKEWDYFMNNIAEFLHNNYPEIFDGHGFDIKKTSNYYIEFYTPQGEDRRLQFYIVCSRDISHQLVRKRSSAFNQESQRYVKYNKEYPIALCQGASNIDETREFLTLFENNFNQCHEAYKEALNKCKFKPEIARKALNPFARTRLYVCDTIAGFKEMIILRDNGHAQPEHEWIAKQIKAQMIELGVY